MDRGIEVKEAQGGSANYAIQEENQRDQEAKNDVVHSRWDLEKRGREENSMDIGARGRNTILQYNNNNNHCSFYSGRTVPGAIITALHVLTQLLPQSQEVGIYSRFIAEETEG